MTPRLTLRPVAGAEIAEAYDWYEEQWPGLGKDFLADMRSTLAAVEEAPLPYPVSRGEVRRALLRRFPNFILYLADSETAVVIACFHARRHPRRWHHRS